MKIGNTLKYAKLQYWQLSMNLFDDSVNEMHWLVSAHIKDTEAETVSGMMNTYNGETGCPVVVKPSLSTTSIPIMQIRAVRPIGAGTFDLDKVYVYKYWKKALVPLEEQVK